MRKGILVGLVLFLAGVLLGGLAVAFGTAKIETANLDDILKKNPLGSGQMARAAVAAKLAHAELQVIEMTKIRLHHHDQEDHIVFVVRGHGTARLEDDSREVKPGDVFTIPKKVKHGFAKTGDQNLVLLTVATPGWKPLEDTKFYE
jgi:mannose-6-phosphate isomerase-like protein (cupin superfamily)